MTEEFDINPKQQGQIELIGIPKEIRKEWHHLLKELEETGLTKKWLWNWYFVIILGKSHDSYKRGNKTWTDKFTDGRIILEKIDETKYKFYEHYVKTEQKDYNQKLDELRGSLDSVEKEWHHWACYDQGKHGSDESKRRNLFTGKTPTIKPMQ